MGEEDGDADRIQKVRECSRCRRYPDGAEV
jgi:hypothetical protein